MDIPKELVPLLASVGAALIAGAVAYLVAVLSKESKTSEFRQAWIDGLREDISELVGTAQMLGYAVTARKSNKVQEEKILEFLYERHDDFVAIRNCHARILLRLNPKEHKTLIARLAGLGELAPLQADDEAIEKSVHEIVAESQVVLKAEWTQVKRGEAVFRWTKYVSLSVVVACTILGVGFISGHISFQYVP